MDKFIRRIPAFGIGLVVSYALLVLLQIWTGAFGWEWFTKLSVTYGVIAVVLGLVYLLYREAKQEEKLKDDHYLD
jgi:uncharacterized BrkB/YihY/UPF0761 family membrane protein